MDFQLSEEEQAIFDMTRDFSRNEIMPVAAKYDQSMDYPWEVIDKAFENGLMNLSIPERFGGPGVSHLMQTIVTEQLAYGCSGISTAMTASDLALGPLLVAGSDEQIREFVEPMIQDPRHVAAYCVTEPGAGSDVQGIRTLAKKDGDDYIISGEKMWITNASVAKWYYVLATTAPGEGHRHMIAFVVPSDLPGIEPGKKEVNMGQRCSDTRGILFNNVRVPERYRLGKEGDGFKIAMKAFDLSRPGVAAGATGVAQAAFEHATRYAQERQTFGRPIASHQAVQFMLADMATEIEASRLLTYKSAQALDLGQRNTKHASFAKCFAGDTAMRVTTNAVQIFGGYGYNSEYPVEKLMRDAKIYQIYEGTQQIQRMIISRHVLEENQI